MSDTSARRIDAFVTFTVADENSPQEAGSTTRLAGPDGKDMKIILQYSKEDSHSSQVPLEQKYSASFTEIIDDQWRELSSEDDPIAGTERKAEAQKRINQRFPVYLRTKAALLGEFGPDTVLTLHGPIFIRTRSDGNTEILRSSNEKGEGFWNVWKRSNQGTFEFPTNAQGFLTEEGWGKEISRCQLDFADAKEKAKERLEDERKEDERVKAEYVEVSSTAGDDEWVKVDLRDTA